MNRRGVFVDGDGAAKRVRFEATGQPDVECATNDVGAGVFAGVVLGGNGGTATHWRIDRGCRMDAAIWTGGLCHW